MNDQFEQIILKNSFIKLYTTNSPISIASLNLSTPSRLLKVKASSAPRICRNFSPNDNISAIASLFHLKSDSHV